VGWTEAVSTMDGSEVAFARARETGQSQQR
jgi:hypothetical protein